MDYEPFDLVQLQAAIQQANARWEGGETWLTELSAQEKLMRLGVELPSGEVAWDERERIASANLQAGIGIKAIGAPASYDLRNVNGKSFITPIKNQKSCGKSVQVWIF